MVVPTALRPDFLQRLHTSHQGYEATLRRARDAVYWPGMADQIKSLTASCTICEKDAPAQPKERLLAHEIPKQPWAKVGMDLFKCKGKDYLVIVDYLTDFFEISELSDTTSATVIKATKKEFTRHGVPLMVQSDGGPQFTSSEFQSFAKTWEFQHTTSSPYNSRSNGKAESAVKIAKRLLKRSQDPYRALLEWRNTPTAGLGSSPAQRLLARQTRAAVPTNPKKLKAAPQSQMWEKKVERQRKIQASRTTGKDLPPLRVGQPVLVQDVLARKTQWSRGYCVDQLSDRSYVVNVDGRFLRRNRQLLRPTVNQPDEQPDSDEWGEYEDIETQAMQNSSPEQSTTATERMMQTAPTQRETLESGVQTRRTRSGRQVREPVRFGDYVK